MICNYLFKRPFFCHQWSLYLLHKTLTYFGSIFNGIIMIILDVGTCYNFIWIELSKGTKSTGTFEIFFFFLILWTLLGLGRDNLPAKWSMCSTHNWNAKSYDKWWQLAFVNVSQVRPSCEIPAKHSILSIYHIWYTRFLHTLYILTLPTYCEECFQRENHSHNSWELEIVIPTILYTIYCGFPQLLPLHFQILERLIAQTLTTPMLSVKWDFSAAGKHWKKPFVWWMQLGWIAWFGELEKTRLGEVNW